MLYFTSTYVLLAAVIVLCGGGAVMAVSRFEFGARVKKIISSVGKVILGFGIAIMCILHIFIAYAVNQVGEWYKKEPDVRQVCLKSISDGSPDSTQITLYNINVTAFLKLKSDLYIRLYMRSMPVGDIKCINDPSSSGFGAGSSLISSDLPQKITEQ